jgi:4-amino-4-deoxy-L-arabinose transferase-like glycosyltransferase
LLRARPLWLDEALIAINVLSRPLHGFFRPLDSLQISPLGFLWLEWLATRLAGAGELALRAVPFAAGVLALIAFSRLARRLLDPAPALLATALLALSPLLIHYSAEAKSYGLDLLTAILLIQASLDLAEAGPTQRALLRWALVAALAALLSTPAPFSVAGCALVLLAVPRLRHDPASLLRFAAAGAPAALIFLLQLLTLYHSPQTTSFMQHYWTESFLEPRFPGAIIDLAQTSRQLWISLLFGGSIEAYLPRKTLTLLLAFSVVGGVSLWRRHRLGLALLVAPLALASCAALAQWWPLAPRLLLFAAPVVLLTLTAGLATLARLAPPRARAPVLAGAATILLAGLALGAVGELREPILFVPVPAAMEDVGAQHGQAATVYVAAPLVAACSYYSAWHPNRARLVGDSTARECAIRGARPLTGTWPPRERNGADPKASEGPPIRPDWVTGESKRILEAASGELWLMVDQLDVGAVLRPAIEQAGAVLVAERRWGRIRLYRYRTPPRS